MRSARSSRFFRPERTYCAECDRVTRTSTDGICPECWTRKEPGVDLAPLYHGERGSFWHDFWENVDDFVLSFHGLQLLVALLVVLVVFVLTGR